MRRICNLGGNIMSDVKLAENLIMALQYEYKTYLEVLKIAETKTDSLVNNDAQAIASITNDEQKMAEQTVKLSQVREQILKAFSQKYNQDYKTLTIGKIKDLVKDPYKSKLNDIQEKLSNVMSKLYSRNEVNKKLIENAIKYLDFNLQLITAPEPATPTYGKSGLEEIRSDNRSMLDIKY